MDMDMRNFVVDWLDSGSLWCNKGQKFKAINFLHIPVWPIGLGPTQTG